MTTADLSELGLVHTGKLDYLAMIVSRIGPARCVETEKGVSLVTFTSILPSLGSVVLSESGS